MSASLIPPYEEVGRIRPEVVLRRIKPEPHRADPSPVQKRAKPTLEKRRRPRRPRRLSCELWLGGTRHTGIVKDVSEIGLYVQTRAKAAPGTRVALVFAAANGRPEVRVVARVARTDRIHAHLAATSAGGLGLEVIEATRELALLLADAGFAAPHLAGSGAR